jgi:hypothetical protein
MTSVSLVTVGQDTMQSHPVSVCVCQIGHNAVMAIVSAVPVRQDTPQSWPV